MNKEKPAKVKKTFYIDDDLVMKIRIKSAIEDTSDTNTVNSILGEYFTQQGNKYSFPQTKNKS